MSYRMLALQFLVLWWMALVYVSAQSSSQLRTVLEYRALDWVFPTETDRANALASGEYIPGRHMPIDVDVHYSASRSKRLFLSGPRFALGLPASLSTIQGDDRLFPYPDWSWHVNPAECRQNRIISVFRTMVDECDRLWVLDTGLMQFSQLCAPQLLAFDLNTDTLISQYDIPSNQYTPSRSILATPMVDVRGCGNTFVYIADVLGYGLIVYDAQRRTSWRVNSNLFFPYPPNGNFTIGGESFDFMVGVIGLSLSPYRANQDRTLYFHSLASVTESFVSTAVIRDENRFTGNPDAAQREFFSYPGKRPSQAAAQAIDRNGIAYFGLATEMAIACWNTQTPYGGRNLQILSQDDETLQFASGIKVVNNRKGGQEVWILTDRFQKQRTGTINPDEVNYRILAANTEDYTRGSKCARSSNPFGGNYRY